MVELQMAVGQVRLMMMMVMMMEPSGPPLPMQRLNLGLMWWGVGTALALWLAPAQPLRYALGCVGQRFLWACRPAAPWEAAGRRAGGSAAMQR